MILVAGGESDPNVLSLARKLAARGLPHLALLVGDAMPTLSWDIKHDQLIVNGAELAPTAVFLRYDVFSSLQQAKAETHGRAAVRWYHAVLSWVLAHDRIAFLNRRYGSRHTTKPYQLFLTKCAGLAIPETLVTNDAEHLAELASHDWIVKPVNGGEYTRVLADALCEESWAERFCQSPTIVQSRLVGPDLRIYRVGDRWFAFILQSSAIDYRLDQRLTIQPAIPPVELVVPLAKVMEQLGLDFGAADFKRCPESGRYLFLEVNSAPMFTAFDRIVGYTLSDAILDWLLAKASAHGGAARLGETITEMS